MGDSIATENYKKNILRYFTDWAAEADAVAKDLKPIKEELDKLAESAAPDKKRVAELEKKRDALGQRLKKASDELRLNIIIISAAPEAPEKELIKVPPWLEKIIKAKGIPLGKSGVIVVPKVEIDFKAKKLKYFGIEVKW